jgi:cobalt-zinc-cadmium efflux system protein
MEPRAGRHEHDSHRPDGLGHGGHPHGGQDSGLPASGTQAQRRALRVALALNSGFLIAQVAGGIVFSSLALLADAAHMLTDIGALTLALVAFGLAARPASPRHSYGLQRAELLAALANGLALLAVSVWLVVEAVDRIGQPHAVAGGGLLAVASAGLLVNAGSAWLVARSRTSSVDPNLNLRAALLHLVADALGSVAAVVAGLAVVLFDATWMDPAASLAIVVLVAVSGWRLLRDVVHVLLEGTPSHLDPVVIAAALHDEPVVERVHHLHVWRLSSGSVALSAHLVTPKVANLHEAQLVGDRLKALLRDRFGIDHATLELECHDCRGQHLVILEQRHRPR